MTFDICILYVHLFSANEHVSHGKVLEEYVHHYCYYTTASDLTVFGTSVSRDSIMNVLFHHLTVSYSRVNVLFPHPHSLSPTVG